jgi:chemotaxis protein MotA
MSFVFAMAIFMGALFTSSPNVKIFMDAHGAFIVGGGTLAATAISVNMNKVFALLKVFFTRVIKGKNHNYAKLISEMMNLSEMHRKGEALIKLAEAATDGFLKEALNLANDALVERDEMMEILEERIKNLNFYASEEANRFKNLAKYPPAFGLFGTSVGMIVLLGSLNREDAMQMIGPSMAIALNATMYGVALSNMVIAPISENLVESAKETHLKNKICLAGLALILDKINPLVVAEKLNSFLPENERLDWKKTVSK